MKSIKCLEENVVDVKSVNTDVSNKTATDLYHNATEIFNRFHKVKPLGKYIGKPLPTNSDII